MLLDTINPVTMDERSQLEERIAQLERANKEKDDEIKKILKENADEKAEFLNTKKKENEKWKKKEKAYEEKIVQLTEQIRKLNLQSVAQRSSARITKEKLEREIFFLKAAASEAENIEKKSNENIFFKQNSKN